MVSERASLNEARPEYVNCDTLNAAADAFVLAMGTVNAKYLARNLRLTKEDSDALRALNGALIRDFNVTRQEEIRKANAERHRV